jgi:hypothetical protein
MHKKHSLHALNMYKNNYIGSFIKNFAKWSRLKKNGNLKLIGRFFRRHFTSLSSKQFNPIRPLPNLTANDKHIQNCIGAVTDNCTNREFVICLSLAEIQILLRFDWIKFLEGNSRINLSQTNLHTKYLLGRSLYIRA